jgi:hypothetical protein
MRPVLPLAGCLLALIVAVNAPAGPGDPPTGEPVKFTYSWQPGMTTYCRMITTSDAKTVQQGATSSSVRSDRTAMLIRMETYSVRDDGTARIASTVVRVRREQTDESGNKETFDSAASMTAKVDPIMKMYGSMVDKTIIMEITPDGRVLHAQGLESFSESMIKNAVAGDSQMEKSLKEAGLSKFFKELIAGAVGQTLPKSPYISSTPRRVGDQWPLGTGKINVFGSEVSSEGTCTFDSIDKVNGFRVAKVFSNGTTSMQQSPTAKDVAGSTPVLPPMTSTGTTTSVLLFDLDRGRTVRYETRILSTVKMPERTIANHTTPGYETNMTMTMLAELVGPEDPIDPEAEPAAGK